MDDVRAIRAALAAGPTEGEWRVADRNCVRVGRLNVVYRAKAGIQGNMQECIGKEVSNAAYIAACHPDRIRRLLARLEAAEKDAARWRDMQQTP